MRRYIFLLCAFVTLTANAQSVSESEAFQKAQKFLNDKKLKAPRATTRGEEVMKPFYVFNAEDGKGCVIISGDERLPEVLVYSKEQTIDENNIPSELKELIPILSCDTVLEVADYTLIPSEYVPRNTTVVNPIMPCANSWQQWYPLNQYCPAIYDNDNDARKGRAYVGCLPIAVAQVMNFFKYPKSVDAFDSSIAIELTGETRATRTNISVPYTEFKWDLIKDFYDYGRYTDEEGKAGAELCFHVGCAFQTAYRQSGSATNNTQKFVNWVDVMKNIYKYDEVKFIQGESIERWNESINSYAYEYYELPDEEYWNFLDSYLERGIPMVAGGGHAFIIDGRDDRGMYYWNPYYVILQPSLWRQIGSYGALTKYNYFLNVFAFVPPNWKASTAINSVETKKYSDGAVYNLQGRKVGDKLEGLPKGVYIKDGKKQVVK